MANKGDGENASVAIIGGAGTFYRLDVSTTAATYTNLPKGNYIVVLSSSVSSVSLRNDGTAAAEPSSGASGTGGVFQTGWSYEHPATGNLSAIVLESGSGRMYLVPVP